MSFTFPNQQWWELKSQMLENHHWTWSFPDQPAGCCDPLYRLSNAPVGGWTDDKRARKQVITYATTSKFVLHLRPVVTVLDVLNYCIVWCQKVIGILQHSQHTVSRFLIFSFTSNKAATRYINKKLNKCIIVLDHIMTIHISWFQLISFTNIWYGDDVGNTTEEYTSIFYLIQMC